MAPRTVYANLADGLQPFTLWDASLADMGLLGALPYTATGTNTVVLTPIATAFAPSPVYLNRNLFSFAAAATSTGAITLNVNGLGALPLYRVNGTTQATTGDLIINVTYLVAYNAALNAGNGGFQIISPGSIATSGALLPANNLSDVANAATSFDNIAPTTTRGDLIFRNATTNTRLAAGTLGYHLQSAGPVADPTWSGFLNPGTGGATRTWNTKAAEWVSVKDFGALGDNSTNDTAAIQNAINSLTTGGTLYFPPGFYVISAALTISVQGITIMGANRLASVIRKTSATTDIFTVTGAYARIDSIGLVGTTGTVSTAGYAINASVNSCVFTNLFISDVFSGLNLSVGTNFLVSGVKLLNIYGAFGINVPSGGGNCIVDNQLDPVFYGAYTMTSGFGAWATGTVYALNAVRSANGGFYVCTQAGTSAGAGGGPVITAFGTTIVDNTVRWLFICSTTAIGLNVAANSNFCAYNDVSGPWVAGINVTTADGNIVQANTVGQVLGSGINLGVNATNTLVHGNLVSGAYGTFAYAIGDGNGSATGSRFLNNIVSGSGWMGIIIQSANCMANDNWITGTSQLTGSYGIEVTANVNNFTISNNTIVITAGMNGPVKVAAGTSDNYKIMGNQTGTGVNLDGGTGNNKTVDPSFGVGYYAGAGGAVPQTISKATGVTLNKACGAITMNNAALAAATIVSFVLTNTTIAATDVLILNHISGGTVGSYLLNAQCAAGSATINVRNETAGSLSEAIVLQFVVVKAAIT